jgi:hypothetical protein
MDVYGSPYQYRTLSGGFALGTVRLGTDPPDPPSQLRVAYAALKCTCSTGKSDVSMAAPPQANRRASSRLRRYEGRRAGRRAGRTDRTKEGQIPLRAAYRRPDAPDVAAPTSCDRQGAPMEAVLTALGLAVVLVLLNDRAGARDPALCGPYAAARRRPQRTSLSNSERFDDTAGINSFCSTSMSALSLETAVSSSGLSGHGNRIP